MACDATLIADLLVPFAEAGSLRLRDMQGTLRKRIIVSLHFADPERVHDTLFQHEHLDWVAVRAYLSDTNHNNAGTAEWVRLVALFHFINEPVVRPPVRELLLSAATGTRVSTHGRDLTPIESLQLCFARAGVTPAWDALCKTLILSNLADVDAALALTLLLLTPDSSSSAPFTALLCPGGGGASSSSSSLASTTAASSQSVIETVVKYLPSCKHSRDEYSRTFVQLLGEDGCHVASHLILQSIRCREEAQLRARQNALALLRNTSKPSISRILEVRRPSPPPSALCVTVCDDIYLCSC
jgi:hypothetical protein